MYGSGLLGPLGGRVVSLDEQFVECADTGVWAFGDSILRNDGPDLAQRLYDETGLLLAVDSQGSRPTAGCVDALEARVQKHGPPAVVLMGCGTNDIFDPPRVGEQTRRVRELLPDTRVVWVDVWVKRWKASDTPTQREYDLQNSGWVNAQIHHAAGRYGWGVVRWHQYLSSPNSSGQLSRPGQCLTDGCHTSLAGQVARNTLIVQALT